MAHSNQTATRIRKEVEGVIIAAAIYDTAAVLRMCGIGRNQLIDLRTSGRLSVGKSADGRQWYRGSELIELFFSEQQKQGQQREQRRAS